jgi:hypothetical protein
MKFFGHGPKRPKKAYYPSSRLSVAVILLPHKEQSVSNPALGRQLTTAKELGNFLGGFLL